MGKTKPCTQCGEEIYRECGFDINKDCFCSRQCRRVHHFYSKINKIPGQGPYGTCWEWLGQIGKNGYGAFGQKKKSAHRSSFVLSKGQPRNLVLHKCNNKKCCNPDHLYDGTYKENTRDAIRAGTKYKWTKDTRPNKK